MFLKLTKAENRRALYVNVRIIEMFYAGMDGGAVIEFTDTMVIDGSPAARLRVVEKPDEILAQLQSCRSNSNPHPGVV